jgi:hypothetical protein
VTERDRLAALQAENERLAALLDSHGIQWRQPPSPQPGVREPESTNLSTDEKIALFRRLFRGRVDVYPVRWESKTSGKSGYAPACGNEWRPGICEKPRIKCGDCGHRLMLPVSDDVIFGHLAGKHTVGIYPLLPDDTCHLLAVDFDEAEWREDARAFAQSCADLGVPVALEISRSVRARTLGSSSRTPCWPEMPAVSVQQLSRIPALACYMGGCRRSKGRL